MISRPDCRSTCPWRPPDWRWRRALDLADHGRRCHGWDDHQTASALEYMRRSSCCKSPEQRDKLRRQLPAIGDAHRLHVANDVMTWMVQARVLANEPPAEIARLAGLATESIEVYEALFFDIRDRLDGHCSVNLLALRRSPFQTSREDSLAWLLRTLGYFGGPHVLERAEQALAMGLWCVPKRDNAKGDEPLPGNLQTDKVRLLASLLTLPEDCTADRILELMAEIAKSTQMDGVDIASPLTDFVDEILNEGPFEATPAGDSVAEPKKAFDEGEGKNGNSTPSEDNVEADQPQRRETA